MYQIILASGSPRRKELLEQIGVKFTVDPSTCKERISDTDPIKVVVDLSFQKACDVARRYENTIIIGSDTIVSKEKQILGKPKNEEDAYRMLKLLQGDTHQVYTGVTVIDKQKGEYQVYSFYSVTDVSFYSMTDEEIYSYINTKEPMDKAGAYGIQGKSAVYIKEIKGDYNTVVGLPVAMLYQTLLNNGINLLA
ncbi:septum formation protein [Lachnotalea glycerini]|uniref:dTTP/UTP pyrophosphatase n=1 Tax=Lachnotalea glycerini TaxID=1763509 RepID=A0A255IAZ9_9FIRM|nr:Maf family protein [Lachnotalea glycerini]PXV95748.1 septum formation protein [Lachnotalea glycerini]RDY33186.1 septum formation inhibitor Maf [Lachnotalea glycerini]